MDSKDNVTHRYEVQRTETSYAFRYPLGEFDPGLEGVTLTAANEQQVKIEDAGAGPEMQSALKNAMEKSNIFIPTGDNEYVYRGGDEYKGKGGNRTALLEIIKADPEVQEALKIERKKADDKSEAIRAKNKAIGEEFNRQREEDAKKADQIRQKIQGL